MSPTTAEAGVHGIRVPAPGQSDGSESMIPDPAHPDAAALRPYAVGRPADSAGPARAARQERAR